MRYFKDDHNPTVNDRQGRHNSSTVMNRNGSTNIVSNSTEDSFIRIQSPYLEEEVVLEYVFNKQGSTFHFVKGEEVSIVARPQANDLHVRIENVLDLSKVEDVFDLLYERFDIKARKYIIHPDCGIIYLVMPSPVHQKAYRFLSQFEDYCFNNHIPKNNTTADNEELRLFAFYDEFTSRFPDSVGRRTMHPTPSQNQNLAHHFVKLPDGSRGVAYNDTLSNVQGQLKFPSVILETGASETSRGLSKDIRLSFVGSAFSINIGLKVDIVTPRNEVKVSVWDLGIRSLQTKLRRYLAIVNEEGIEGDILSRIAGILAVLNFKTLMLFRDKGDLLELLNLNPDDIRGIKELQERARTRPRLHWLVDDSFGDLTPRQVRGAQIVYPNMRAQTERDMEYLAQVLRNTAFLNFDAIVNDGTTYESLSNSMILIQEFFGNENVPLRIGGIDQALSQSIIDALRNMTSDHIQAVLAAIEPSRDDEMVFLYDQQSYWLVLQEGPESFSLAPLDFCGFRELRTRELPDAIWAIDSLSHTVNSIMTELWNANARRARNANGVQANN
jgi:hypothetical protein